MTNVNKITIKRFDVKDAKKVKDIEKALKRSKVEYFAAFEMASQSWNFVLIYDEYGNNMLMYSELMKVGVNIMPQTGTTGASA